MEVEVLGDHFDCDDKTSTLLDKHLYKILSRDTGSPTRERPKEKAWYCTFCPLRTFFF